MDGPDEMVAQSGAGPDSAARLLSAAHEIEGEARRAAGLTHGLLVVPDIATGEVVGSGVVGFLRGPDDGAPDLQDHAAGLRAARPPRGTTVFGRDVQVYEVATGVGVVEVEIRGRRLSRTVESAVSWTVFPTDCADQVIVSLRTPFDAWLERVADEARFIVDHLELVTEQAP